MGGGIFQALDFFRESTSICAVDCFILISGYFGIKWKFKSFYNLVFQIFFYSIGIYVVAVLLGVVDWTIKAFLIRFCCLFTQSWGFVVSYIILYFCSPVLNLFAEKSSTKELFMYIIIIVLALNFISISANSAFTYSLVYLIGRFLHKIEFSSISGNFPAMKAYLITTTLIFIFVYLILFKLLGISDASIVGTRPLGSIGYDYASPLVILQSVFLFTVFSRLSFRSWIVNYCAKSCFALFLIHMHPSIKDIGYLSYSRSLYDLPVLSHVGLLLVLIASVFILSIIIDQIRLLISNFSYLFMERLVELVPENYKIIENYIPQKCKKLIQNN